MVERARKMHSEELSYGTFNLMQSRAQKAFKGVLDKLSSSLVSLVRVQEKLYEIYNPISEEFELLLQRALTKITDYPAEHSTYNESCALNFYFDALQFATQADSFGEHSIFDIYKCDLNIGLFHQDCVLSFRNVIPANFLSNRFKSLSSITLFSATLSLYTIFYDIHDLSYQAQFLDVESPFDPKQLKVTVAHFISTRFHERSQSRLPLINLVAKKYLVKLGNCTFFASQFQLLK